MQSFNLTDYINLMEKWSPRTYLVDYHGYRKIQWTYEKVRSSIFSLSKMLKDMGVKKGDRIILSGQSSPEWVVAFFAILHRGGVVVPVDHNTQDDFFRKIFQRTSPVLALGDKFPVEINCMTVPLSSISNFCFTEIIDSEEISQDDLAEIVFTSGTTSEPKGVMLTHGNILSNLLPIDTGLERRKKLVKLLTPFRFLCTIPFTHMFGQVTGIFLPLLLGSTLYFAKETGPAYLIRAIHRDRIIALVTVPRIMKLLADHIKVELKNRGKWASFENKWDRLVKIPYQLRIIFYLNIHRIVGLHFWAFIVGGAPLDPETHEFYRRLVYAVFQGYGLTETSPIVTMFNPFRDNKSSVGKIFPGQEVKVNPDGEILVKGKNVMVGYFNDREATAQVIDNGWLKTGDIGEVDSEGQVFIKGRKKEMILTSDGLNVFPEDVENVLHQIEGVRDGVVLGLPLSTGESVHAVLLLESGVSPEDVIKKANAKLQPYQKIRGYTLWEGRDFPRTPTLKVKKNEVLKKISSDRKTDFTHDDILEGLVSGSIDPDSRLKDDLGLDSLDMVEIVSRIEKKYGISIDETIIGPETTVKEIEKLALNPRVLPNLPMPRWTRRKFVGLMRRAIVDGIFLPAFHIICKVRANGLENLEKFKSSPILAVNHGSDLDPLAILLSLPFRYRKLIAPAMGLNRFYAYFSRYTRLSIDEKAHKKGLTNHKSKPLKSFIHGALYYLMTFLFQVYPFPQGAVYRSSLEYAGELLDNGLWLLIFPEGEVSDDGKTKSFKGGIAILAERTGAPVVPVGIKGMHYILPRGKRWPRIGRVTVSYGEPMIYNEEGYDLFASQVEKAVAELISQ